MKTYCDRTVDAVLPAGGRIEGTFAQETGVEIKALLRFEDETILSRTIRTLRATRQVARVVVVGPEAALQEARNAGADGALAEGATGPDNIFRGLEWLQQQPTPTSSVLIVTTDMPFLTPTAVTRFLDACPPGMDICVPVVERKPFEARFPGLVRTDTRLRDGWFRLGGLFLLDPTTLLRIRPHIESMFGARKSNLQMAKLIGFATVLRYLTRRLTVEGIVARACEILGCRGVAMKDVAAEIGFDIDLPEEYTYAKACFSAFALALITSPSPASPARESGERGPGGEGEVEQEQKETA